MYSLNRCDNGLSLPVESYDNAIEILSFFYPLEYSIKKDNIMPDVWWISINGEVVFMLTNLQKVFDVEK